MTFNPVTTRIPTSIGTVKIGMSKNPWRIWGAVQIMDDQGDEYEVRRFADISEHLTPAQITGLQDFMTAMETKAQTEILP